MTATTDRHGRLVAARRVPGSSQQLPPGSSRQWGRIARAAGFALLAAIPLVMFALFFFYPARSLIGQGLTATGTVDAGGVVDVLGKPRIQRIAVFTLWQAAASAALAVLLGRDMIGRSTLSHTRMGPSPSMAAACSVWPVRLRQVNPAARRRRPGTRCGGQHLLGRRGPCRGLGTPQGIRPDVPGRRALPAP